LAYNYNNSSAAYNLDLFAPAPRQVPQRKPELRPQPRLVKPQVKTKQEIRAEALAIRAKMIKFSAVLVAGVVLLGANVALHIQDNELNNAIVKLIKNSERKRVSIQGSHLFSIPSFHLITQKLMQKSTVW
jgi:hypothetical protein